MKKFKSLLSDNFVQIAAGIIGVALLFVLLWFRLGSLTYGNAADIERTTFQSASSWQTILDNPLNAPYTVAERLVHVAGHHGITSLRLVSTIYAVLAAVLFYFVARQWHSLRVALLATWLFISSGWFLHVGRLGSPEILWLVSILAIVILLTPNKNGRHNRLALPSTLGALATVMYVPGMVWLVLAGVLLQRKNIREAWAASSASWLRAVSLTLFVAILVPLGYGLARAPELAKQWLGFAPNLGPNTASLQTIAHNLIGLPESLFYKSSYDAVHWLGSLPLLSSFEIIMFLLGLYFYATHLRAARTRLIVVLAGIAWLLVGITGLMAISLVVPVVYLLVAAGIAYILHQWLKVFPYNPIARTVGIAIVMAVVLLTSVYQTRSYFVAWRYNTETTRAFNAKLE